MIVMGTRTGGVGLGVWGGVGVAIFVFVFRTSPGSLPIDAVLIILSVILASATMQAAGGVDWLVAMATKLIQRNPKRITVIAPIVSCLFTMGAGTGNVYYPLIPVISDLSAANGVRPERPLAIASVASQLGVAASPVSAAMAVMVSLMEPKGFSLPKILAIVVPATFVGIIAAALVVSRLGPELRDDPEYQRRIESGELDIEALREAAMAPPADLPRAAGRSAQLFLAGVSAIIVLGVFSGLRPQVDTADGGKTALSVTITIEMVMFVTTALILVLCRVKSSDIAAASILRAGIIAIVALFGLAWMADTFISANSTTIVNNLGGVIRHAPWTFTLILFAVAAMTTSQSGATKAIVPIGIALGVAPALLVAMWPAVIGIYFFPANGSQIAAVNFDRTGTTKIGGYVVNHSFMLPMLVSWVVSVLVGIGIALVFFGV
jgi:anaerobic C4-dicarboxylate transporter DcuA/anaerobic C4-dicarboxylate transporter DcuB